MRNNPPAWIDSLVDRLAPPEFAEEIRGDLYELFRQDVEEKGARYARRRYMFNGLGFLAKSFFWKRQSSHDNSNPFTMLYNYFRMARRSLLAYKGNTVINVLGLVTGIASALVILTVIRYELSFDAFHSNADRIYRMVRVNYPDLGVNKRSNCRTGISYPVPQAIREEISALENIVSMQYFGNVFVEIPDKSGTVMSRFREESGCVMVEPSFFKVFDFKGTGFRWIAGNPETALKEPLSVVLTRSLATKYFPDGNALGMTLKFEKEAECKVTGVIEDLPPNTDFPFTVLVSYATLRMDRGEGMNDWGSVNDEHQTYVMLAPGTTVKDMERQIAKVHEAHTSKDIYETRHYLLQELRDVHHDTRFSNYRGRTISRETITAIALVGLFLLLTAAINYINLATAQSVMRAREIGLRKVMGSNRKHLVVQLLTETFVVVFMAGIVALVLAELLLLNLQPLLDIRLTGNIMSDPFTLLSLLAIVLAVTLFSGLYPSLVMSRFNPVVTMKNRFATEKVGGFSLRKVLVVAQFTVTQILVVGTFMVVGQMQYFRNVDMGFNQEAIITVPLPGKSDARKFQVMEDQLRSQAWVADVSFSSTLPSGVRRSRSSTSIGKGDASVPNDYIVFEYQGVDPSYLDLYQIRLLAGRNLAPGDSSGDKVIINKKLAGSLQLGSPEEAIGKELKMVWGQKVTVAGVIDNYYANSMKEGADNMVLVMDPRTYDYMSIKLNAEEVPGSWPDAVKQIERIWTAGYPEHIFAYEFFDDNIRAFYAQEEKYAKLFQIFSIVFLLIGCLGLYGLITFVVNRKGKEVAIRKVLGATVSSILLMFSREYVRLIVLSFLIAVPVAYYAINSWLENFTNHIDMQWWLFAVPGLLVLAIALLVVVTKSMRTANANPVEKLKYE